MEFFVFSLKIKNRGSKLCAKCGRLRDTTAHHPRLRTRSVHTCTIACMPCVRRAPQRGPACDGLSATCVTKKGIFIDETLLYIDCRFLFRFQSKSKKKNNETKKKNVLRPLERVLTRWRAPSHACRVSGARPQRGPACDGLSATCVTKKGIFIDETLLYIDYYHISQGRWLLPLKILP